MKKFILLFFSLVTLFSYSQVSEKTYNKFLKGLTSDTNITKVYSGFNKTSSITYYQDKGVYYMSIEIGGVIDIKGTNKLIEISFPFTVVANEEFLILLQKIAEDKLFLSLSLQIAERLLKYSTAEDFIEANNAYTYYIQTWLNNTFNDLVNGDLIPKGHISFVLFTDKPLAQIDFGNKENKQRYIDKVVRKGIGMF